MKDSLTIRVQDAMCDTVAAENSRKPRDAGRRFTWFCNRGVNQEYQCPLTLSKNPSHFQALYDRKINSRIFTLLQGLSIIILKSIFLGSPAKPERRDGMSEINEKLKEISDTMNEHIITVKGTLELLDASVTEDDLRSLVLKAIERMDNMQELSDELFVVLKQVFEKIRAAKDSKE
jgi:hypothetical protein